MAFYCLWWHSFSIISRSRRLLRRRASLSFLCVKVLKRAANASPYLLFSWTDKGCFNCKYQRGTEYSAGPLSALAGGRTCWGKATVCTVPAGFLWALHTFHPFCSKNVKKNYLLFCWMRRTLNQDKYIYSAPLLLQKMLRNRKDDTILEEWKQSCRLSHRRF